MNQRSQQPQQQQHLPPLPLQIQQHLATQAQWRMSSPTSLPPLSHDPLQEFESKLATALETMHTQICTRLNRLDGAITAYAKVAQDALQEGTAARKDTKDAFDRLQTITLQTSKCYLSKVEKVEKILGDPDDPDQTSSKTVLGRVQSLEQAVFELTETVSDPDAARPLTVKHNKVHVATNTADLFSPPKYYDVGVQGPVMVDVGIDARPESPRRFSASSRTMFAPSPEHMQAPVQFGSYTVQPLVPAQWKPQDDESDSSMSSSATPPAFAPTVNLPKESFTPEIADPGSVVDEQEIMHSLEMDTTPTPPLVYQNLSQTFVRPALPRRNTHSDKSALSSSSQSMATSLSISASEGDVVSRPLPRGLGRALPAIASSPPGLSSGKLSSPPSAIPDRPKSPQIRPRSASMSSMSSLTSIATTLPPLSQTRKNRIKAVDTNGLSRARSLTNNRSGIVRVKAERTDTVERDRPAKRRKMSMRGSEHGKTPSVRRKGTSHAKRKNKGRDSVPGTSTRKSAQRLVITPIRDTPVVSSSHTLESKQPKQIGTDRPWPAKISGDDEGFRREFVQCDNCEGWYHFGCVGLTVGDPRLEPDAEFTCPPCDVSSEIREERRLIRYKAATCLRPDCPHPGEAEEYFIDRIIGRRPFNSAVDLEVKRHTAYMWLVKWDGYKADVASWTADEHLGECSRMIEEFEQAAEIEGRDLDQHDRTILLNEAKAAGFEVRN